MEAKDIRNLQEAYLEVYQELDEASYSAKAARAGKDIGKPGKAFAKIAKEAGERYGSEERGKKVAGAVLAKLRREEVDIYDIILSHLLDEGYAETPEAAERIMVNMSEEWRDSIVEAEGSYGQTPKARQAMSNLAQSRAAKPASEYGKRGEKTKKVGAAEKHVERMTTKPHRGRGHLGPADSEEREHARGMGEVGSGRSYSASGGSVTKNPKKLRKQKAMGEHD